MKKNIAFLLLIVFILLMLFVGCSSNVSNDSPTSLEQTFPNDDPNISYEELFDYEMKHQPSDSDVLKITKGMPFDEVVDIIGLPHGIADNVSISSYFKWVSLEGNEYILLFILEDTVDNADKMEPLEYYRYTVTASFPRLVESTNTEIKSANMVSQGKGYMLNENFFDEDMKSLPSDKDFSNIRSGMTFDEVIQLIGRPHGIADRVDISGAFKWNTVEGNVYVVYLVSDLDCETARTMTPDEIYQNSIVGCAPRCVVTPTT